MFSQSRSSKFSYSLPPSRTMFSSFWHPSKDATHAIYFPPQMPLVPDRARDRDRQRASERPRKVKYGEHVSRRKFGEPGRRKLLTWFETSFMDEELWTDRNNKEDMHYSASYLPSARPLNSDVRQRGFDIFPLTESFNFCSHISNLIALFSKFCATILNLLNTSPHFSRIPAVHSSEGRIYRRRHKRAMYCIKVNDSST